MIVYASGEQPAVGDLVHCIEFPAGDSRFLTESRTLTVTAVDQDAGWVAFVFDKFQDHPGWSPSRFRLIRRAKPEGQKS